MKKILLGLIATIFISFSANSQNLRRDFLQGKTKTQMVDAYNKLSQNDQRNLWLEKMDQLLSLPLPAEHLKLISLIRSGLEKGVTTEQSTSFLESAAKVAKITPVADYGAMFESLSDYKFNGKFSDTKQVSETHINYILNIDLFSDASSSARAKPKCSCRWCLGYSDNPSTDCTATSHGCGFLWLQSCNQCVVCD
jgi:hypothetical protein